MQIKNFKIGAIYIHFLIIAIITLAFVRENIFQWIATIMSVFAVMSSDSIQTIGTYLSTHRETSWKKHFVFIGSTIAIAIILSWIFFNRQLHFNVLENIPYNNDLSYIYIIPPLALLILARCGIPASSTFIILSSFTSKGGIVHMINKTFSSYCFAFLFFAYFWFFILKIYKDELYNDENKKLMNKWKLAQKMTTVILLLSWLFFSLANMVLFLPRTFSFYNLCLFLFLVLSTLAVVLINKGGKLQDMINKKQDSKNIKVSTLINSVYAGVLILSKALSNTPISTTFVLLGILAGKELTTTYYSDNHSLVSTKYRYCIANILRDLNKAILGIIISLIVVKFVTLIV